MAAFPGQDQSMAEDNWLNAKAIQCPACGMRLYRVDPSPFDDGLRISCDRCPRSVRISTYDETFRRAADRLAPGHSYEDLTAAVEPLLRGCPCGGRFRGAPPRCFSCGAVAEEAGAELYPYIGCEDLDRDPTADEQAAYDRFEREFILRDDPWESVGG